MGDMSYSHGKQKNMGYYFCAGFTLDYLQQAHSGYSPLHIFRTEDLT
jgi:hypothetical protein